MRVLKCRKAKGMRATAPLASSLFLVDGSVQAHLPHPSTAQDISAHAPGQLLVPRDAARTATAPPAVRRSLFCFSSRIAHTAVDEECAIVLLWGGGEWGRGAGRMLRSPQFHADHKQDFFSNVLWRIRAPTKFPSPGHWPLRGREGSHLPASVSWSPTTAYPRASYTALAESTFPSASMDPF